MAKRGVIALLYVHVLIGTFEIWGLKSKVYLRIFPVKYFAITYEFETADIFGSEPAEFE